MEGSIDEGGRAPLTPLASSARKREEVRRLVSAAYDGLVVMVRTAGSRDLTLEDLLRAHRTLMEGDPTEAPDAGRLRTVQNWIGGPPGYPVGPSTSRRARSEWKSSWTTSSASWRGTIWTP